MRLSRNAFTNLAVSMIGFGVVIGLVFPFAILGVGLPAASVLTVPFFAFTVVAGVLVGGVNIVLASVLVRPRLRLLASRMREVEAGITDATYTGDWTKCDPERCAIPVDSEDEFGAAAAAFNRLLVALSQSHRVETRLSGFTEAMSAELDVEAICQAAIDSFRQDLGAAGVAIIGNADGKLRVLASHGLSRPRSLVESDLVTRAIRSLTADSMSIPEHLVIDAAVAKVTPQHVLVYPLVVHGKATGAVVLASSSGLAPGTQALGAMFMRTLSVALANAVSHESIQRIAAIDVLTGVVNRRSGLERLHEVFRNGRAGGAPVGLVMVDIDHFKVINDTHGHLAGDAVLVAVAGTIRGVLRRGDVLVRYGGEEFLVLLPGAGREDTARVAERIRTTIAERPIAIGTSEVHPTVSVGFVSTSAVRVAGEMELIALADEALYRAKDAGRNRIAEAA
jgi:diguanylate cyclase (GGDEF)-like protein